MENVSDHNDVCQDVIVRCQYARSEPLPCNFNDTMYTTRIT